MTNLKKNNRILFNDNYFDIYCKQENKGKINNVI